MPLEELEAVSANQKCFWLRMEKNFQVFMGCRNAFWRSGFSSSTFNCYLRKHLDLKWIFLRVFNQRTSSKSEQKSPKQSLNYPRKTNSIVFVFLTIVLCQECFEGWISSLYENPNWIVLLQGESKSNTQFYMFYGISQTYPNPLQDNPSYSVVK